MLKSLLPKWGGKSVDYTSLWIFPPHKIDAWRRYRLHNKSLMFRSRGSVVHFGPRSYIFIFWKPVFELSSLLFLLVPRSYRGSLFWMNQWLILQAISRQCNRRLLLSTPGLLVPLFWLYRPFYGLDRGYEFGLVVRPGQFLYGHLRGYIFNMINEYLFLGLLWL